MFILTLRDDPLFFFATALTVVVSICLHELAHGWAAIRQGDDTPIQLGHMTFNPMVHMGPASLLLFVFTGMAFGAMPVNPLRFRSRYGNAIVSGAGPAMNLVLALIALVILGLWMRLGGPADPETAGPMVANGQQVLWIFTTTNVALALFNLLPVPPLDGSSILADIHAGYRQWIQAADRQAAMLVVMVIAVVWASRAGWGPYDIAYRVCQRGLDLFFL